MRWRAVAWWLAFLLPAGAAPASWERCVEEARTIAEPCAARDGFHCNADGQIEWVPYGCESPPRSVEVRRSLPSPTGGRYPLHTIRWSASGQRTAELRMNEGEFVHGERRGEWLGYDEAGAVRFRFRYDERGELLEE